MPACAGADSPLMPLAAAVAAAAAAAAFAGSDVALAPDSVKEDGQSVSIPDVVEFGCCCSDRRCWKYPAAAAAFD